MGDPLDIIPPLTTHDALHDQCVVSGQWWGEEGWGQIIYDCISKETFRIKIWD